jgi:hypothetical protein
MMLLLKREETEMPRIKMTHLPEAYAKTREVSRVSFNENNDCAVVAISIVCGVPYDVAHAACKAAGRKDCEGTHNSVTEKAINSLGFRIRRWSFIEMQNKLRSYPTEYRYQSITSHHLRRWAKSWEGCHPNMLWGNGQHIWAVKDGVAQDWSINKSLRVGYIYEVEKA